MNAIIQAILSNSGMLVTISFLFIWILWYIKEHFYTRRKDRLSLAIQDYEQVEKFFVKNKIEELERQPQIIQYMACNTISVFKGITFDQVISCVRNDITFYDFCKFINLEKLRKQGYLTDKYVLNRRYWLFNSPRIWKWISWSVFVCISFIFVMLYVVFKENIFNWIILIVEDNDLFINREDLSKIVLIFTFILIFIAEWCMLWSFDKRDEIREHILWYEKNKDKLRKQKIFFE
ncbi:Uncharacterised protein [Phocoenobacter uteri]|uniref:Uncharacterized protein n=1 Tax=Phocoenobacter uteri TaxID=146806 RepID=A0A379C9I0_9PAST|nr:hypothetical protein [Phocoenobacter uteri]MDG6882744.1 hypothetical protein [Phocoenobacter uteri]SUB58911.1 Uncharacterised protein [Phocoenobacter uteri]